MVKAFQHKLLHYAPSCIFGICANAGDETDGVHGTIYIHLQRINRYLRNKVIMVKAAYNKRGGNEYVQIIVSLMEGEIICQDDVARFQSASRAIADMMFNKYCCQIAYAVHGNTDNLHAHFVINSVRYVDGYKLQLGKKELFQLKTIVSDILNQYGFSRLLYYSADENLEN